MFITIWYLEHLLWNYSQVNYKAPDLWKVHIGLGKD